jgi:diguanylate cyclase (GGDEF)-like protein
MTALFPIKSRSSALWLKAFVIIVCLAIVALEGWRDWSEREQEISRIKVEMKNLAKSLAQHAHDTLVLADSLLIDVVDRVENGGVSPEAIAGMEPLLAERIQPLQQLKSLSIYGEDGSLLSSSLPGHRYKVNGQDLAFFQHHKELLSQEEFFGPLIQDPLGSDWVLTLSRRVNKPDGGFGGVVQVSIPPRYFANFFSRFDLGSRGLISLFNTNGTLLSRYPYVESIIGANFNYRPWFMDGATSGSYEFKSAVDGLSRLSGYQRNHVYPIGVLSSVEQNEALARWNREFVFRLIAVTVLVSVIGTLGWSLVGQLRRREEAEAELAILATTDGLTGLANRRTFDKWFDTEWLRASREGKPLSLLLIDVDQFKAYNDIYGHQAGDECLKELAKALSTAARGPNSLVARYGGEELTVLLPDTDDAGAVAIAEEIRAQVESLALRHDANIPSNILTISIGSATYTPTLQRPRIGKKDLITLADSALYRAKQEGRNRVSAAKAA